MSLEEVRVGQAGERLECVDILGEDTPEEPVRVEEAEEVVRRRRLGLVSAYSLMQLGRSIGGAYDVFAGIQVSRQCPERLPS
jgi:hypothetical protein